MQLKKPHQAFFDEQSILTKLLNSSKKADYYLSKYRLSDLLQLDEIDLVGIKGLTKKDTNLLLSIKALIGCINHHNFCDIKLYDNASVIANEYSHLKTLSQEHFIVLFLNHHKKLIKDKCIFIGTINMSIAHPREIFKEAYLIGASFIILIHNHPSGDTTPSLSDLEFTKKVNEVGKIHSIIVLDHIIIGDGYYSFFQNRKL